MTLISLDGSQFTDVDTLLLGALTLSAATGQPFEMTEIGKIAGKEGISPLHLTALRTMAQLCHSKVEGDSLSAKRVHFSPQKEPDAASLLVDIGETTGRPSSQSVTPLIEMLIPVLMRARNESLMRFRGVNASPLAPSAFWLRETLVPMLLWIGINIGIEIEQWGWYPDGGGLTTLLVPSEDGDEAGGSLYWKERGDPIELWGLVALSQRTNRRVAKQMLRAAQEALATEPIQPINVEEARVRSPGPGNGLFLSVHFEHATAGFESIARQGMGAEQVVEEAVDALTAYFWSDAAFEPELARAMMLPIALSQREASFTTSEITLPMRILEYLIPRFLPVNVSVSSHPAGGQIEFVRA